MERKEKEKKKCLNKFCIIIFLQVLTISTQFVSQSPCCRLPMSAAHLPFLPFPLISPFHFIPFFFCLNKFEYIYIYYFEMYSSHFWEIKGGEKCGGKICPPPNSCYWPKGLQEPEVCVNSNPNNFFTGQQYFCLQNDMALAALVTISIGAACFGILIFGLLRAVICQCRRRTTVVQNLRRFASFRRRPVEELPLTDRRQHVPDAPFTGKRENRAFGLFC